MKNNLHYKSTALASSALLVILLVSSPFVQSKEAQGGRTQEAVFEAPSSGIIGVENASMRPSSNATAYVTYEKDDGTVEFALRVEDVNWTEQWGKRGTPVVVSNVVGKAGVGVNREDAKANLSSLQTKKDRNGAGIVYFDQTTPFRGIKRFYLRRSMSGYELYPVSLQTLGCQATQKVTKYD